MACTDAIVGSAAMASSYAATASENFPLLYRALPRSFAASAIYLV